MFAVTETFDGRQLNVLELRYLGEKEYGIAFRRFELVKRYA